MGLNGVFVWLEQQLQLSLEFPKLLRSEVKSLLQMVSLLFICYIVFKLPVS